MWHGAGFTATWSLRPKDLWRLADLFERSAIRPLESYTEQFSNNATQMPAAASTSNETSEVQGGAARTGTCKRGAERGGAAHLAAEIIAELHHFIRGLNRFCVHLVGA